jgi:hypothetical protein
MISRTLFILFCLVSFPAVSGTASGLIKTLLVSPYGIVIFDAGEHSGKPVCSVVGNEWAFSIDSSAGKAVYALLLAAKAQNQIVNVIGRNDCSYWPDREAPDYMYVN